MMENEIIEKKSQWVGYVIAGITLGAAIGNMFLAGKIKNVMKIKFPKQQFAGKREPQSSSSDNWKQSPKFENG